MRFLNLAHTGVVPPRPQWKGRTRCAGTAGHEHLDDAPRGCRTIVSAGGVALPEVRPGTPAGRRDPGLRAVQGTTQRTCRIGSGSVLLTTLDHCALHFGGHVARRPSSRCSARVPARTCAGSVLVGALEVTEVWSDLHLDATSTSTLRTSAIASRMAPSAWSRRRDCDATSRPPTFTATSDHQSPSRVGGTVRLT